MRATMMLCDAAQVADGKLFVLGGGWSLTGPDPMPSAIAIKVDVPWLEAGKPHVWHLDLVDADGKAVMVQVSIAEWGPVEVGGEFNIERPDTVPAGTPIDVALAVNLGPLPLPPGGRYTWRLSIDGETRDDWLISFTTRPRPLEVAEG